jgi:hypothetical protein
LSAENMWFLVAMGFGLVLVFDVCHFHLGLFDNRHITPGPAQQKHAARRLISQRNDLAHLRSPNLAPKYLHTVMPTGQCNISDEDGKKAVPAIRENTHFISTAINPNYGVHVVVLGRDSRIYHKHQIGTPTGSNWTAWKCLTPDFTKVPCSSAPYCGGYDNFPQMIAQKDGTLVVFTRQMDDLVPHEMHLTNPKDPDSWSPMRGPTCLCNFPPCAGQDKCGVLESCDNKGVDCDKHPHTSPEFWHTDGPVFPTSELSMVMDEENKINMFFRGFDGAYYRTKQVTAGDAAGKYGATDMFQVEIE